MIGESNYYPQLWKGDGTGHFSEVSKQSGIKNSAVRTVNWVDYNNDGYLDLYIRIGGEYGYGILYENNGNGSFEKRITDITGQITDTPWQVVTSFADIDNDGDMDMFIGGSRDDLYINNGDGTFTLNKSALGKKGTCRGLAWGDYNNDGFIDLYVVRGTSDYYRTLFGGRSKITFSSLIYPDPGELTFRCSSCTAITFNLSRFGPIGEPLSYIFIGAERRNPVELPFTINAAEATGIPAVVTGQDSGFFVWRDDSTDTWHVQWTKPERSRSPGQWGEILSDGDFINVTTNMTLADTNYMNTLYRNNGDGTFTDVTKVSGTGHIGNNTGATWGDYDNDGYLDLYVVDSGDITGNRTNTLYRNLGDGTFEDVTSTAGVGALDADGRHYGATWGDFNNDGALDLFITQGFGWGYTLELMHGTSRLYKNLGTSNNWIKINLTGTSSNRYGIGARVVINTADGMQSRQLNGNGGESYSQGIAPVHFGLGSTEIIDSITIYWPSGIVQTLNNIGANQELTVTESSGESGRGYGGN